MPLFKELCKAVGGYNSGHVLGVRKKDWEQIAGRDNHVLGIKGKSIEEFFGGRGSGKFLGVKHGGKITAVLASFAFPEFAPYFLGIGASADATVAGAAADHKIKAAEKNLEQWRQKVDEKLNEQKLELERDVAEAKGQVENSQGELDEYMRQGEESIRTLRQALEQQQALLNQAITAVYNNQIPEMQEVQTNLEPLLLQSAINDFLLPIAQSENHVEMQDHLWVILHGEHQEEAPAPRCGM